MGTMAFTVPTTQDHDQDRRGCVHAEKENFSRGIIQTLGLTPTWTRPKDQRRSGQSSKSTAGHVGRQQAMENGLCTRRVQIFPMVRLIHFGPYWRANREASVVLSKLRPQERKCAVTADGSVGHFPMCANWDSGSTVFRNSVNTNERTNPTRPDLDETKHGPDSLPSSGLLFVHG